MHLVQVGEAALGEGAQQVQRSGGLVVGLQQALGVRYPALGVETDAVDDIAAVGRQGDPADGLVVGRARFGELAGHAPDFHHRTAGGEGHDDGHLQQHLEGVADLRRAELGEALGAVATLQQEGTALGHLAELAAQLAGFAGKYQRRVTGQDLLDLGQVGGIGVVRLLLDRLASPAFGTPGLRHDGSRLQAVQ
ncbi:hypothetical protein D3C85_535760 [compost metagenome]